MNRRNFLKTSLAASTTVLAFPAFAARKERNAWLLSEHGCGRATGYAEANKIITHDGKTHAAWIDSQGEGFHVRIRTFDHDSQQWSDTYAVGDGYDNHGGPALTMDGDGYLHIAYYPHHHPMRYRKSIRPNDASEWGVVESFGEKTTYPTLVCAKDGTLICTCRESNRDPWVVNRYIKNPGGDWQGPHTIMQSENKGYSHFMDALAWGPDHETLHLCTRMYNGQTKRGHTVGYMRSRDMGQTWETHTGQEIDTPVTPSTIDAIAQDRRDIPGGYRAGSIAVKRDGTPLVLYCDNDKSPMETYLARPDGDGWATTNINQFLPEDMADADLIMPGGVMEDANGRVWIVISRMNPGSNEAESTWGHLSSRPHVFLSEDGGDTFETHRAIDRPGDEPLWLPSIERPTGFNTVERPSLMWTRGGRGPNNKAILSNQVWWTKL